MARDDDEFTETTDYWMDTVETATPILPDGAGWQLVERRKIASMVVFTWRRPKQSKPEQKRVSER